MYRISKIWINETLRAVFRVRSLIWVQNISFTAFKKCCEIGYNWIFQIITGYYNWKFLISVLLPLVVFFVLFFAFCFCLFVCLFVFTGAKDYTSTQFIDSSWQLISPEVLIIFSEFQNVISDPPLSPRESLWRIAYEKRYATHP